MGRATLTGRGRRRLLTGHPWIYADDVAESDGRPGELLPVFDPNENSLGWALFSSHSRITLRMVTRSAKQPNRAFWVERVGRAVEARSETGYLHPEGACRLLGGDADGLPGFVVDRYADVLVVQSGCQGSDAMRDFLLEVLLEVLPFDVRAVLDRSDSSVRRLEDLEKRVEWIRGKPVSAVDVADEGLLYSVEPEGGHKTGHYLDQRQNRLTAATFGGGVEGARVLDAFSYDGLFGIRAALAGAAEVLCLDQSAAAGERLLANAERNGVADRVRFEKVDVMQDLRARSKAGESFDRVVVDPPAFARNRREIEGAARGYRELNLRAISLLRPGGRLVTCSCSYNVDREAFLGFVVDAAHDAGRTAFVEGFAGASPDHPWLLNLPESSYLKCAFVRVDAGR